MINFTFLIKLFIFYQFFSKHNRFTSLKLWKCKLFECRYITSYIQLFPNHKLKSNCCSAYLKEMIKKNTQNFWNINIWYVSPNIPLIQAITWSHKSVHFLSKSGYCFKYIIEDIFHTFSHLLNKTKKLCFGFPVYKWQMIICNNEMLLFIILCLQSWWIDVMYILGYE